MERRRATVAVGVAIAVVVAGLAAGVWLVRSPGPAAANCDLPAPNGFQGGDSFVVVPCGTSVNLRAHSYVGYSLARLSDGEMLVGAFAVTSPANGTVEGYMLNTTQFGYVQGHPNVTGPPPGNFWDSGAVASCNFTTPILPSPAQYYLVVENTGPGSLAFVWSKTLMFYYDSTA